MLAGVSSDYYVRLEQGRDQHPSRQVLDALARSPATRDAPPPTCTASRPPRPPAPQGPADREGARGHLAADRVLDPDPCLRPRPVHGRARRQPPRDRARTPAALRARTSSAPSSSTRACVTCTGTGSTSPRAPSPGCGRSSVPTSTIPASTSWWASSRSAASASASSGRDTTPHPSAAAPRGSPTPRPDRWSGHGQQFPLGGAVDLRPGPGPYGGPVASPGTLRAAWRMAF